MGHQVLTTETIEQVAFNARYVSVQPNVDGSAWRLHGQLPAQRAASSSTPATRAADVFPTNPDGTVPRTTRNADALWSSSLDSLIGGDGGVCTAADRVSRSRLHVHHTIPWSHGGRTDPSSPPQRRRHPHPHIHAPPTRTTWKVAQPAPRTPRPKDEAGRGFVLTNAQGGVRTLEPRRSGPSAALPGA